MSVLTRLRTHATLVTGISVLLIALGLAVFVLPGVIVSPDDVPRVKDRLKLQNDVRGTLLQAVAGVALVTGAYFTARNVQIARESRDIDREQQITDRFTKAIEQLGHDNRDVKVGGIYALERIARDSARDHPQVVEVLATFVRTHGAVGESAGENTAGQANELQDRRDLLPRDIHAALVVLGRRTLNFDPPHFRLYLSGARLSGAYLNWTRLPRTRFAAADLSAARFYRSNLQGAEFDFANLEGANFNLSSLTSARFYKACLRGARFILADLCKANFEGADLTNASLNEANLCGANLVTDLDSTSIHAAAYDSATKWPEGFDPTTEGAVLMSADEATERHGEAVANQLRIRELESQGVKPTA